MRCVVNTVNAFLSSNPPRSYSASNTTNKPREVEMVELSGNQQSIFAEIPMPTSSLVHAPAKTTLPASSAPPYSTSSRPNSEAVKLSSAPQSTFGAVDITALQATPSVSMDTIATDELKPSGQSTAT